jgi:drug/metabolite transporter (DMT)-like permease
MAVVLGILVAASFGSGDFLGGRSSARASTPGVLLLVQASALAGATVVALVVSATIETSDLVNGAIAGGLNVIALGLLYLGLATGRMGVVAPVTAVVASIIPVTYGLAQGERPSPVVYVGIVAAVTAGALISITRDEHTERSARSLMIALGAGACFGSSFIFYARTSSESGFWPILTARTASLFVVAAFVLVLRTRRHIEFPSGSDRGLTLGAGLLDVAGSTLILIAIREDFIVTVTPVAALAPAVTVLWAWLLLHERISRMQFGGLLVALTGLALIAAG